MAFTIDQLFAPAFLSDTVALVYTASASQRVSLTTVLAVNTSLVDPYWLQIHLVPTGGAPSDVNIILPEFTLRPGESRSLEDLRGVIVPPEAELWAFAEDPSVVSLSASGLLMP